MGKTDDDDAACHFREKRKELLFNFNPITPQMNP
jgi:hypothetical protein